MMVIVSDNTATNLTIDSFGVNAVNARIASLGLKDTHLWKRVMKSAAGPMPADQRFGRMWRLSGLDRADVPYDNADQSWTADNEAEVVSGG